MEILTGVLLLFQLFLLIKLIQMNQQILQQIAEQRKEMKKMAEQKETVKKAVEEPVVPIITAGQTSGEKRLVKASEQEKLIDEVLSEVFPV